jgi:glycosyltransferase involved in cell wall biosynthesis
VDFFSHAALPLLSRGKPLVWRLSDMWAFTGHCSYAYECERWRTGCGACPHLDVHPGLRRDTTALLWRAKRALYARSRFTVVAPSRWMERLARESPLLGRFPVHRIPNGVDLDVFRPRPAREARGALGIQADGPVLLLGAYEPRKGQGVMAAALAALADAGGAADVTLLTVGARVPDVPRGLAHHHLGEVKDDRRLALVYAAADAFVFPTLAENLPNMVLESLACGVPVVSFDVGGVGDAVRPGETGFLARPADARDLAAGMRHVLDAPTRARLAARCRQVAEQEYSLALQARRFLDLHRALLAATPARMVQ